MQGHQPAIREFVLPQFLCLLGGVFLDICKYNEKVYATFENCVCVWGGGG